MNEGEGDGERDERPSNKKGGATCGLDARLASMGGAVKASEEEEESGEVGAGTGNWKDVARDRAMGERAE